MPWEGDDALYYGASLARDALVCVSCSVGSAVLVTSVVTRVESRRMINGAVFVIAHDVPCVRCYLVSACRSRNS